jgi:hypothetical protein
MPVLTENHAISGAFEGNYRAEIQWLYGGTVRDSLCGFREHTTGRLSPPSWTCWGRQGATGSPSDATVMRFAPQTPLEPVTGSPGNLRNRVLCGKSAGDSAGFQPR